MKKYITEDIFEITITETHMISEKLASTRLFCVHFEV